MFSKSSCRFVAAVASATVTVTTWSPVALADAPDRKAAARAKLEYGATLLKNNEDARALAAFEEAYRIFPSPKIFFDIGVANVGLTHNPQALRAFQRFLIEATDASVESVTRARTQVQALLPKVGVVDVLSPQSGLEIIVDEESVGRSPLAAPLYLDPGPHRLQAKVNQAAPSRAVTFEVTAGTRITVDVPVEPPPVIAPPTVVLAQPPMAVDTPQPSETRERPIYTRPWFWAVAGGVVAAVGVTLLLTLGGSTKDPTPSLMPKTLPEAP